MINLPSSIATVILFLTSFVSTQSQPASQYPSNILNDYKPSYNDDTFTSTFDSINGPDFLLCPLVHSIEKSLNNNNSYNSIVQSIYLADGGTLTDLSNKKVKLIARYEIAKSGIVKRLVDEKVFSEKFFYEKDYNLAFNRTAYTYQNTITITNTTLHKNLPESFITLCEYTLKNSEQPSEEWIKNTFKVDDCDGSAHCHSANKKWHIYLYEENFQHQQIELEYNKNFNNLKNKICESQFAKSDYLTNIVIRKHPNHIICQRSAFFPSNVKYKKMAWTISWYFDDGLIDDKDYYNTTDEYLDFDKIDNDRLIKANKNSLRKKFKDENESAKFSKDGNSDGNNDSNNDKNKNNNKDNNSNDSQKSTLTQTLGLNLNKKFEKLSCGVNFYYRDQPGVNNKDKFMCTVRLKTSHSISKIWKSDFFGTRESTTYMQATGISIILFSIIILIAGMIIYKRNSERRDDYFTGKLTPNEEDDGLMRDQLVRPSSLNNEVDQF